MCFRREEVLIQLPCLRITGNIVLLDSSEYVIIVTYIQFENPSDGFISLLKKAIFSMNKHIRKETCWILLNLASSTEYDNVPCLIRNGILPILIKVNKTDNEDVSVSLKL